MESSLFSNKNQETTDAKEEPLLHLELDDQGTIKIVGQATVHEAQTLCDALLAACEQGRDSWTLDLRGLSSIDTAGLQLLLSFKRSVASLQVHSCPAPIRAFMEQSGIARHLL